MYLQGVTRTSLANLCLIFLINLVGGFVKVIVIGEVLAWYNRVVIISPRVQPQPTPKTSLPLQTIIADTRRLFMLKDVLRQPVVVLIARLRVHGVVLRAESGGGVGGREQWVDGWRFWGESADSEWEWGAEMCWVECWVCGAVVADGRVLELKLGRFDGLGVIKLVGRLAWCFLLADRWASALQVLIQIL